MSSIVDLEAGLRRFAGRTLEGASQSGLFDPPPRTHAGDPASSHRAEATARQRFLRGHAALVLELVRQHPGTTASFLAERAGSRLAADGHRRLYQVRRRLSDLRLAGKVRRQSLPKAREALWWPA